jgi:hypothetical protein
MERPVLTAIAVLLLFAAGPLLAKECEQKTYGSIDIEFNDSGGVMVPVKINGQDVWMSLDMSAGVPIVFKASAEALGLKPVAWNAVEMTAGSRKITQKVVVDSLRIGGANFVKWDMYVYPHSESDALASLQQFMGKPVLGTLSANFMQAVDLELNLAQKKMSLFTQTRCSNSGAVYWGGEVTSVDLFNDPAGLMVFAMELDGKRVEASLYTQGRTSVLSEAVTKRFFGFDRNSDGITRQDNGNGGETASYRAMGLTARGLAMKNVAIRLKEDVKSSCVPSSSERNTRAIGFNGCFNIAPLSIGTDLLRKLRIYIASKEGKIYFTRTEPAASAETPSTNSAGPASN